MDKHTLSNYGWIVIITLILSVMLAFATPFGNYVGRGVANVSNALIEMAGNAVDEDNINTKSEDWESQFTHWNKGENDENNGEANFPVGNLAKPQLSISSNNLIITPVPNATIYEIYNGNALLTATTQTTINLKTYITTDGTYTIGVIALSGAYGNSEKATIEYKKQSGTSDSLNHNDYIWTGAKYTTLSGTVLQEGDVLPDSPSTGDKYYYNSYTYTYNSYYSNSSGGYVNDETMNGWSVICSELDNGSAKPVLETILNKPIVNMDCCFYYNNSVRNSLVNVSNLNIPNTVKSMLFTFRSCFNLTDASMLKLPTNTELSLISTFNGCTSLQYAPIIPSNTINLHYTFKDCNSLTGNLIINAQSVSSYQLCLSLSSAGCAITLKGEAPLTLKTNIAKTSSNRTIVVE